ncbi:MAG: hypothetical protein AAFX81_19840 [Pseudomonadota bacterium]
MFPYRRGNQRKRSKGNHPRRQKGGTPRRLPGSARELLPLLQPATKALAQALAGNAKISGQVIHARNVVERAEQLITEQQVERLYLRDREEFLEQLARLKLTLSDAEDEFGAEIDAETEAEARADGDGETDGEDAAPSEEADVDPEEEERERERVAAAEAEQHERLRRVAMALISSPESTVVAPSQAPSMPIHDMTPDTPPAPRPARRRAKAATNEANGDGAPASAGKRSTRPRLTLKYDERKAPQDAAATDEGIASEG